MLDIDSSTSENGARQNGVDYAAGLRRASWAFTTRRVRRATALGLSKLTPPNAGDLVLARVNAVGYHSALQLIDGRRKHLFVDDEIVVAYGNRYAPNQFEAVVPKTLGPCQLVAAGGVAGKVLSSHSSLSKGATEITPLGLLVGANLEPVNLRDFALPAVEELPSKRPPILAVVGTAMDSGKTQTAAYLVRGLAQAGKRVGYAKITGTGSGNDTWFLKDAGANPVLDFSDAGHVSTYLVPPAEMQRVFITLLAHLIRAKVEAIVLEIADGVLQGETDLLLSSKAFHEYVDGILFAACDAMGAVAGDRWLTGRNLPLIALGGVLTASPLQRAEAGIATGLPVYSRQDLAHARTANALLSAADLARADGTPLSARRRGLESQPPIVIDSSEDPLVSSVGA